MAEKLTAPLTGSLKQKARKQESLGVPLKANLNL